MIWSSRCGFELNWFTRRGFGRVGCFRVRFVLYTFPVSCVLTSSFCVPWNWEEWIAPFRSSRENNEDRFLSHLVRTTDEVLWRLEVWWKIMNRLSIDWEFGWWIRGKPNRFPIDQHIWEFAQSRGEPNRFSIDQQSEWQPESIWIDCSIDQQSEWQPESIWIDSQSISKSEKQPESVWIDS